MKTLAFSSRNRKEIIRDPLSLVFCVGVPLVMIVIFSFMQMNHPIEIYTIKNLAPGIAVFSFSFISLFSGMLIAKDRTSSFLTRLFASPMTSANFIAGYSLPLLPLALLQSTVCFLAALIFGLEFNLNLIFAILVMLPVAVMFIGFGLLLGCIFSDKQVGGIASILIMLVSFMGGMWFDLNLMGSAYKTVANLLPFSHAVEAAKATLVGNYAVLPIHLLWTLGYAAVIFGLAILVFKSKMQSDQK
jgi:ABC-2 type transport system permease protein